MNRIAIYYIATNKYIMFFNGFLEGLNNFFPNEKKKVILITDCVDSDFSNKNTKYAKVEQHYIDHLYWPIPTLFKMFYIEKFFANDCDYHFYLLKYKDDKRIACISGWSYFYEKVPEKYPYTYYFSHIQSSWGWATWRDRWNMIDLEMKHTKLEDIINNLVNDYLPSSIINFYRRIFEIRHSFSTTWDYQFLLSVLMKNNMYAIQPLKRFVKNIGDMDGTHPIDVNHNKSEAIDENYEMKHPPFFAYIPYMDILRNYQTKEYIHK